MASFFQGLFRALVEDNYVLCVMLRGGGLAGRLRRRERHLYPGAGGLAGGHRGL